MIRFERDFLGERYLLIVTPSCGAFRFWFASFAIWRSRPLYVATTYGARLFGCGPLRGMHFPKDRPIC